MAWARVMARSVAVVAAAVAAMSGCQRRGTCAALVEGHWSNDNALLGLRHSAWLALLGLLRLAGVKVRPLTCWLALHICDTGRRWGGGQRHLLL